MHVFILCKKGIILYQTFSKIIWDYIIVAQYIHFSYITVFLYNIYHNLHLHNFSWLSLKEFPSFCFYNKYCIEQFHKHLPGTSKRTSLALMFRSRIAGCKYVTFQPYFNFAKIVSKIIFPYTIYNTKIIYQLPSYRTYSYFGVSILHLLVLFSFVRLPHFRRSA